MMPVIMKVTNRYGGTEYVNVNYLISYRDYGASTEQEGPLTYLRFLADTDTVIKGSTEEFHKMLQATLALFRCEWRSKL